MNSDINDIEKNEEVKNTAKTEADEVNALEKALQNEPSGEKKLEESTEKQSTEKQSYEFVNVSDEPSKIPEKNIKSEGKNNFVLFCLLFAILTALFFTPAFNVKNVTVTGNNSLTAEEIIKNSGVSTGRNILRINCEAAEKKLEKIPMINDAKILLKFPANIEIKVEESIPAAYVKYLDKYICIDKNAKILGVAKSDENKNLIIVTGVTPTEFISGKQLSLKDADKLDALTNVLCEIEAAIYMPNSVKSIDLKDKNKITLVLDNEINVNMGKNDSMQYKMAYLTKTLETQLKTYRGGTLDLSDPTSSARYKGSAQ